MSRLSQIFRASSKCFIPYVTAGFPDLEATEKIILSLAAAGSHIVEIGIPFSDPVADGPVIQRSSSAALKHGYSIRDYIELVRRLRGKTEIGLIFMSYYNPVLNYGLARLDREGAAAGLDGILISDLSPEEYQRMNLKLKLDTVFLAAPTSSDERLKLIAEVSSGFLYLVARTGVTGKHTRIEETVPRMIKRIRQITALPVAAGFGIRSADDVRAVWEHADGAVVGTAIVRFIEENRGEKDLIASLEKFVRKHLMP